MHLQIVSILLTACTVASANDWPQFRGPSANGHAKAEALPTEWSDTKNEDVSSDVSTPLFYQNRFYVLNSDRKSMSCVHPKTGELIWEHRVEGGAKIESSPTAGDGRIYFQDMRAHVTILAAEDEAKLIFSGSMADGEEKDVRSSIALASGCAFVRTTRMLYCVGAK